MLFQVLLRSIVQKGSLTVISAGGRYDTFGDSTPPHIVVKLHRGSLDWTLGLNPDLKIGEAYVDGSLTLEEGDLYSFIHLLLSNYRETGDRSLFHWREYIVRHFWKLAQFNPISRARRNARFHYDMPDALYAFFLDKDRQYSCGYFTDPNNDLDTAQADKERHIASKLRLDRPGLRVLDIGSGWGGLDLYLARETGARVRGITLSTNQYKFSNERVMATGLMKQCSFALRDYRQEKGPFERIVSVGMFEHVGKKNYDEFFARLNKLLTGDGVCLIHSIGRFGEPKPINTFMRKHVFPGADLPTLPEILTSSAKAGFFATDIEILRLHYAETLKRWTERLQSHRREIVNMFGERLYRKWEFYFIGCEASFRLGEMMVFQLQLTKRQDALPMTRDYMLDWERAHPAEAAPLAARPSYAELNIAATVAATQSPRKPRKAASSP